MRRCASRSPRTGEPCRLPAGHEGHHGGYLAQWLNAPSPPEYVPEPADQLAGQTSIEDVL